MRVSCHLPLPGVRWEGQRFCFSSKALLSQKMRTVRRHVQKVTPSKVEKGEGKCGKDVIKFSSNQELQAETIIIALLPIVYPAQLLLLCSCTLFFWYYVFLRLWPFIFPYNTVFPRATVSNSSLGTSEYMIKNEKYSILSHTKPTASSTHLK